MSWILLGVSSMHPSLSLVVNPSSSVIYSSSVEQSENKQELNTIGIAKDNIERHVPEI